MTVAISTDDALSGYLKVHIVGNAVAAGLVGQIANPEGVLLHVCEAWLYIEEGAHAASTFNIGIAATGVDNGDIMSAFAMNQADGTVWTGMGRAAAEAAAVGTQTGVLWPAASFLTVTSAAQVSTGLLADLFLRYIRLA